MEPLGRLRSGMTTLGRSIKRNRLIGSFEYLLDDFHFDLRFKTQTSSFFPRAVPLNSDGIPHQASRYSTFKRAMKALPVRPELSHFLDFGCGKGRALIMAASLGFQRVDGVEIDESLIAQAHENLKIFRKRSKAKCEFVVAQSDAAVVKIPSSVNVFYFYNPFTGETFEQVLSRILESVIEHPREAYLIYLNPVHRSQILRRKNFELVLQDANSRSKQPQFDVYSVSALKTSPRHEDGIETFR